MEGHEAVGFEERPVLVAGIGGEAVEERRQIGWEGSGVAVAPRGGRDAREEEFEIVAGGAGIAVLLGDGFALFGEADGTVEGTRGQGFEEPMGGAGTAADGSATSVEELHADAGLFANGGDAGLAALEGPLRGDDPGVLVGIGVTDHDLLAEFSGAAGALCVEGEAGAGDGKLEEGAEEFGAAFEVLDRFKKRYDGKEADHALGEETEETGFAGEDVDAQEIGHASGHAHDQRTQGIGAVGGDVAGEHAIRGEHGIGFRAGRGRGMKEGAWRTDLAFKQAESLGLGPVLPLGSVDSGGGEKLADGAVVEGGVLADVEGGEVESEGLEDPADGQDVVIGEAVGPGFAKGLVKGLEILIELGGCGVPARGGEDAGELARVHLHREAGGQEFRGLAPWFAGMHLEDGPGLVAQGGGTTVAELCEAGRGRLDPLGKGQTFGEGDELTVQDDEGVGPEPFQGFGGDFGRDTGMAVAIAANPGAETQARSGNTCRRGRCREAGVFPGGGQAAIEFGNDRRKDVAEVVEDVAAFVGDGGLLEEDFTGAPETFEECGDLGTKSSAVGIGAGGLDEPHQGAMLFKDGGPLGLGGVGGEDGFHVHIVEGLPDGFRGGTVALEFGELIGPEASLGLGAFGGLAEVAHGFGGVFLDGIEELEGHRKTERQPRGRGGQKIVGGLGDGGAPGDPVGQFGFAETGEHLREASGQPADVAVDLAKTEVEVIRGCGLSNGIHDGGERDACNHARWARFPRHCHRRRDSSMGGSGKVGGRPAEAESVRLSVGGGVPRRAMSERRARLKRVTRETAITLDLRINGTGKSKVRTGVPFFDHMLTLVAKHSTCDLQLTCKGDLEVDAHHTVEDCGIALGQAFREALGDKRGLRRYGTGFDPRNPFTGEAYVPMDECLARCVIDFSGRSYLVWKGMDHHSQRRISVEDKNQDMSSTFRFGLAREFFQGFANEAKCNLHLELLYGGEPHHVVECLFKAFARAVDFACQHDPRILGQIPSSKGAL